MSSLASESGSSIQSANDIGHDFMDIDLTSLIISSLEQHDRQSQQTSSSIPPGFSHQTQKQQQQHSSLNTQLPTDFQLNPNAPNFITGSMSQTNHMGDMYSSERKKLFVGNLPSSTGLSEVLDLFRPYGRVNEQLSTVKDDNYAFVHFYAECDAVCAQRALNDSYFRGRYIRVQYSTSRGHIKKSKTMDFREIKPTICPRYQPITHDRNIVSAIQNSISSVNLLGHMNQHQPVLPSRHSCFADLSNISPLDTMSSVRFNQTQPRPIICTRNIKPHFGNHCNNRSYGTSGSVFPSQSLLIPADSDLNRLNQLQQLIRLRLINEEKKRLSVLDFNRLSTNYNDNEFNLFGSQSDLFDLSSLLPASVNKELAKSNTFSSFVNF